MKAFALALLSFLFLSLSNSCSDSSNKKSESQPTFSDVLACADGLQEAANEHDEFFKRKDQQLGLTALHGFSGKSWFDHVDINPRLQQVMIAGGLTAAYLDNDCWPDIVFASGDKNGMVAYINKGVQKGFADKSTMLAGSKDAATYKLFSGVAIADVTGNYQRELVFGNVFEGHVPILSPNNDRSVYKEIDSLPVNRTTYGISFGDINGDGMPDMFLAHWDYDEVANAAPALWLNTDNGVFIPYDNQAGTNHPVMDQRYNFSAQFLDVRHSGLQDLLVASDFGTTSVMMNKGDGSYKNVTDINVITDQHGMGSAIGDIDNNGMMDWFVTAISYEYDEGAEFGNRLYKNQSTEKNIIFSDVTDLAGVRDGNWGWAACMADFNNDGFIDIFHVNGIGYIPEEVRDEGPHPSPIEYYQNLYPQHIAVNPVLFINNGNGTFTDATAAWGLDVPSEGRGVICFDYDRDGDIDIALVDHSTGIQFFENQIGHGEARRFLNIRLVGKSPNTDALGTKVYLQADVGGGHGVQRQMRVSHANNNFNSQSLPDIHFGAGYAERAEYLRIEWPDKTGLLCKNVQTNQFLVFDQRDKDWPKSSDPTMPNCVWYKDINLVGF